jgi:hypothetical protein
VRVARRADSTADVANPSWSLWWYLGSSVWST